VTAATPEAPPPLRLPNLADLTILAVDDNEDARDILEAFLQACGATVVVVDSVDAALAVMRGNTFDLVISDLAMPGKDGIDFIRTLRASRAPHARIPAIALSGCADQYADVMAHGYDALLSKPADLDGLARTIRRLVRRAT
jgi:CheY-like chemotaxis protein